MDSTLDVVRGKTTDRVAAEFVRRWLRGYARTIVELGTGDGRWLYRQARGHPDWVYLGLDASEDRMRAVSFRVSRKPARGGLANVMFVRAAVEGLPQALRGVADEIYILYPWGSLLDAVWTPRAETLSAIGQLAKPGGRLEVHVNTSAIVSRPANMPVLVAGYAAGGIRLHEVRLGAASLQTSWAKRVANGRDGQTLLLRGTVRSESRNLRPEDADPYCHPQR